MSLRLVMLTTAIAATFAASAASEPPLGSRLGDRVERDAIKSERDAALGAQEMAQCLVDKQKHIVRSYLGTLDKAENNRLDHAMDGEHECFSMAEGNDLVEGRMITFPVDIFRGMLSEWMIKRDVASFSTLPALPRQLTYSRSWYALSGRDSVIDEMATCVSETHPAETLELLQTVPYSSAEGASFAALAPNFGPCLRAGAKLTANRQSMRAALADALYQRVANPAPAPVASVQSAQSPQPTSKGQRSD